MLNIKIVALLETQILYISKLSSLLSDCYSMCLKNDCLGAACTNIDPADPAASESEEVQTQRKRDNAEHH